MPETSDSEFSWREYVRRNNNELVATYGNLVHRVLTISVKNFHGNVPEPDKLDDSDKELLELAEIKFQETAKNIEACKFRSALTASMSLAQAANRYVDMKAPWQTVKNDRLQAATTLWVSLTVINCLKISLYPFLPFTSEKLHKMLGFTDEIQNQDWNWNPDMIKNAKLTLNPMPLFVKLDQEIINLSLIHI